MSALAQSSDYDDMGRQMLLMKLAGKSNRYIAARMGLLPEAVEEMVRDSMLQMLEAKQNYLLQQSLLNRLIEDDIELKDMLDNIDLMGVRWFEVLDQKTGKIVKLQEQIPNDQSRTKIIAERRQNALAIKVLLGVDPGDTSGNDRARENSDIFRALRAATQEFSKEISTKLVEEAEKVGRMEASASKVLDITPTDEFKEEGYEEQLGKPDNRPTT